MHTFIWLQCGDFFFFWCGHLFSWFWGACCDIGFLFDLEKKLKVSGKTQHRERI